MSDIASLTRIDLWRIAVPLITPYRLAFGDQTAFDCLIVGVTDRDGRRGWGEAALLPGYTDETGDSAWAFATAFAPRLIGGSPEAVTVALDALPPGRAFSGCAFRTAIEHAAGHPVLATTGRARLLAGVNTKPSDPATLAAEIEAHLAAGAQTLKVKVGWDVTADLAGVALIRSIVAGRARLRIDGNQGYTTAEGVAFVADLEPDGIELVEQPCRAGDWEAAVAVKRAAAVPIMLDESIYGPDDIRRAADLGCADIIKLKLMKMGGIDRLIAGLALIGDCGMGAVLGNGVATDLGCWMEACVAAAGHVGTDGEMNGFLRARDRLLRPALPSEGSAVVLDGQARMVDPAMLSRLALAEAGFGR